MVGLFGCQCEGSAKAGGQTPDGRLRAVVFAGGMRWMPATGGVFGALATGGDARRCAVVGCGSVRAPKDRAGITHGPVSRLRA